MKKLKRVFILVLILLLIFSTLPANAFNNTDFAIVSGTTSLNIRSGPGFEYQWLGRLKSASWVELLDAGGEWWLIHDLSGTVTGYVNRNYLKRANAQNDAGGYAYVNNPIASQFLNLRQFPSYTAPVLGIFYNGTSCIVLSRSDGWCYVQIGSLTGYFREEYLNFSGAVSYSTGTTYSANGGSINIRIGPGYQYPALYACPSGSQIRVYLKGDPFWYVSYNGIFGFMDSSFIAAGITPQRPPQSLPSEGEAVVGNSGKSLNLRENPYLTSRVLRQYPSGTRLLVNAQGEEWCEVTVKSDNSRGYMMSRYLTLYGLPGSATKRVVHPRKSYVYLRKRPSTSSSTTLARIPSGSLVHVLAPHRTWSKVRYKNQTGYIMNYYLKK